LRKEFYEIPENFLLCREELIEDDPIVRGLINSQHVKLARIHNTYSEEPGELLLFDEKTIRYLLFDLKARFEKGSWDHEGLEWETVYKAITSDNRIFNTVLQMESKRHEPRIYYKKLRDKNEFRIASNPRLKYNINPPVSYWIKFNRRI
jgi:hypothetical protein